jgi:PAS domain S-box-containing protein
MSPPVPPGPAAATPHPATRRIFGLWWRRQSPARQDRLATLAPLISVLLFLAAIISAFWYLRNEEFERETDLVRRDTEITQQQINLGLLQNVEQLTRLARELLTRQVDAASFATLADEFARERPEIRHLSWLDARRRVKASHYPLLYLPEALTGAASPLASFPRQGEDSAAERAFREAIRSRQPTYSRAFDSPAGEPVFQLYLPLRDRQGFAGTLLVEYAVRTLLRQYVPPDVAKRRAITVVDDDQQVLASIAGDGPALFGSGASILATAPLGPQALGLTLRAQGWRTSIGLIGNTLFWMVVALSALTVWMLLGAWRHMRRRAQIQSALVQETNFRRAMENSMPTGMRAMDLEGRITYVNAAFCQMTGYAEPELVGCQPPYPYWPSERTEENTRLLHQELLGRSPAGGVEVRLRRKDGSRFDARMYVSPLIDPRGQQTGWMTSMTNITEAKRIRDQLSASHERFTTVLEGLDASVSVLSVQQGELLFTNRSYRLWFGGSAEGHALLAGNEAQDYDARSEDGIDHLSGLPTHALTEVGTHSREVFVEGTNKWFDVRARYLQWTDGRLAQMLIATDISARRRAEAQAAAQAEKAQVTSRLVTMGEMASSVAHELNQPLTAITNYCNGMVSRVQGDTIEREDLVAALRKTAHQAERAGQIIKRIRAFVKRSEPQRQPAHAGQIIEDAVDLAGIELRRRNVRIQTYVAQHLPDLLIDPILIEQVVLNLLKNSAEAIDAAGLPSTRRQIELRVVPRHTPDEGGVIEFSVTDSGPGLKEEVVGRLYEAFFSTKAEGLGIGLSLCRSIVESHRGRMRAQNLYNSGTVVGCQFTFTLPVERAARPEAPTSPVGAAVNPALTPE